MLDLSMQKLRLYRRKLSDYMVQDSNDGNMIIEDNNDEHNEDDNSDGYYIFKKYIVYDNIKRKS